MSSTKNALNWLTNYQAFAALLPNVRRNQSLEHALVNCLPSYLLGSVKVIGLQDGKLTLAVPNVSVANRVKHLSPSLIGNLSQSGWKINVIRTKMQSFFSNSPLKSAKSNVLTEGQLTHFSSLESTLDDSPLKDAVNRLLSRHRLK